ncbi:hypothetical protein QYF36_019359 [Acer negundo]|nr:hypothetical protein QYF36_019359 [Acer negundo]
MKNRRYGNFLDLITDMAKHRGLEDLKIFCVMCWHLWYLRNDFVHNRGTMVYEDSLPWSSNYVVPCKASNHVAKVIEEDGNMKNLMWKAPDLGYYKFMEANFEGLAAGIMAVHKGVRFSLDCGLHPCIFESDSCGVVERILNGKYLEGENRAAQSLAKIGLESLDNKY